MKPSARRGFDFLFAASLLVILCSAVEMDFKDHTSLIPRKYPEKLENRSDKVHGIIMATTVVLIFPLGGMSWKMLGHILSPKSLLWFHIGCQMVGLAMLITGFGVGVWVAILHVEVYNDSLGHVVLGTIIVGLFLLQHIIGTWHHKLYKAGRPNKVLHSGHIWFGRVLIILGIVNGGTGLELGVNTTRWEKVYGALAGIIGVTYMALVVLWYFKRPSSDGKNGADYTNNGDIVGEREKMSPVSAGEKVV